MKSEEPDGIATQRVLYFVCHLSNCGFFASEDNSRFYSATTPNDGEPRPGHSMLFSTN